MNAQKTKYYLSERLIQRNKSIISQGITCALRHLGYLRQTTVDVIGITTTHWESLDMFVSHITDFALTEE